MPGKDVRTVGAELSQVRRLAAEVRTAPTGSTYTSATRATANAQTYDADARRELWRRSLELVGHPGID